MKEWQKIFIACFIGGFIGAFVAVSVAPQIWLIGLLAGTCAGYISYEFKKVLLAIPRAFTLAHQIIKKEWSLPNIWKLMKWCCMGIYTNPLVSTFFIIFIALTLFMIKLGYGLPLIFPSICALNLVLTAMILPLLIRCASYGEELADQYEQLLPKNMNYHDNLVQFYALFIIGILRGIATAIWFFIWPLWKYLAKGIYYGFKYLIKAIYYTGKYLGLFIWFTIKLIHSDERLLCGVDSAIGAGLACLMCPESTSILIVSVCGGLIGAGWGVLNYQLISLKILKLKPLADKS